MSLTDDFGQPPQKPRNRVPGSRKSGASPVVRTANNRGTVAPSVQKTKPNYRPEPQRQPPRPQPRAERYDAGESRPSYPAYETQYYDGPKPILNMAMVLTGLWKYRGLAAVLMLVCAVAGVAGLPMLPKKFSAETSIYFDPTGIELAQTNAQAAAMSPESISATIDSQTRILTSRVIMKRVALKLGLNRDPEFFYSDYRPMDPNEVPGEVIDKLTASAESKREQNSYVVTLKVSSKNPNKSADIANTIVQEFVAEEAANLNGLYTNANSALGGRVAELAENVKMADQAIEDYKSKNDLVTADGNLISDKRLISLNDALLTAQNKTIQAKAQVDFVAKLGLEAGGTDKDMTQNTSTELANLRRQYSEQAARVGSLQSQLGSRHPILLAAKASLDGIAGQVKTEQDRIMGKAKAQLQQAQQAEEEIGKQLNVQKALQAGSSSRMVGLKELQRNADSARALYDNVLKRANDTGEKTSVTSNNVRVISEAVAPGKADGPAKSVLMIAGGFGGILMGLVLAILFSLVMTFRSMSQNRSMASRQS